MTDKIKEKNPLQYYPLSMYKTRPKDFGNYQYELRNHIGKVNKRKPGKEDDIPLPPESLIEQGRQNKPQLLFCVTMYNEPFEQLMQTLAGVYRSYYELVDMDESFYDRVHVVMIADGYDKLDEEFLMK